MRVLAKIAIMLILCVGISLANPIPSYDITEFSTNPPWIELVFGSTIDLSGIFIVTDSGLTTIDSGVVAQPGYFVLDQSNTSGFRLGQNGGYIHIEGLHASISYGLYSSIPAPLPNESAAMGDLFWDYNFNQSPNPGGADLVPPCMYGQSRAILNEIAFHNNWENQSNFIELYNTADSTLDISNYQIICNARYTVPQNTLIYPHRYYTLDERDFPSGFTPDTNADNVYLLNSQGSIVDQVGWSSYIGANYSLMRFPDGNVHWGSQWDFMGYDENSSSTFIEGFPSRNAFNRDYSPGLKPIGLTATISSNSVTFNWTNPIWLSVFSDAILHRSTESFPQTPFDGDIVYEGRNQSYIDTNLTEGQTYYYTLFARSSCGLYSEPDSESQISVYIPLVGVNDDALLPEKEAMLSCYPNPFNASTVIRYDLWEAGQIKLAIYNVAGQIIASLEDGQKAAGEYSIIWDGSKYASGSYYARLECAGHLQTTKMILLK
jgi:hypothetical protein